MLQGWENFFMVCGTAAATLVGLLFVAVTVATRLASSRAAKGVDVFLTPTLVHFSGVLFVTLILLAPWPSPWPIGCILCLSGLAGLAYAIVVFRRMRRIDFTDINQGDRIAYAGAPAFTNTVLIAGAIGLIFHKSFAPYAIAGAIVLLLFIAIRDAWGLTLWIVKNQGVY